MSLNHQQELFVLEYLKDQNATQAAIRAGYSPKTAMQQGSRLLCHVEVGARIREAQAEQRDRTKIDADWVLNRLAQEVEADIADIHNDDGSLKPIKEWPMVWRKGLVAGFEIEHSTDRDGKPVVKVAKVKVASRDKRLELLGKHIAVGAFREQVGLSGSLTLEQLVNAATAAREGKKTEEPSK